ncbi:MAG: hypothetical protein GQE15_16945 [Archangiaceae bacterium]|nr:hypothetical protein [Archangiaceae bacterium]
MAGATRSIFGGGASCAGGLAVTALSVGRVFEREAGSELAFVSGCSVAVAVVSRFPAAITSPVAAGAGREGKWLSMLAEETGRERSSRGRI